jgi:hypothetical protein
MTGVRVTMLLADAAQAAEGKLYVLGGGWSVTGPDPSPFAIAMLIQIPWDQANVRHLIRLELLDSDGHPVTGTNTDGNVGPIAVEGQVEVGRPPGVRPGTPLDVPLAMNFGPMPLPPGERFVWQLSVNGRTDEDWRLSFSTRRAPGTP